MIYNFAAYPTTMFYSTFLSSWRTDLGHGKRATGAKARWIRKTFTIGKTLTVVLQCRLIDRFIQSISIQENRQQIHSTDLANAKREKEKGKTIHRICSRVTFNINQIVRKVRKKV